MLADLRGTNYYGGALGHDSPSMGSQEYLDLHASALGLDELEREQAMIEAGPSEEEKDIFIR